MTCHPVEYGQGEPPQQPPPPSRCPTLFGAECASAMPPRPALPRDPSIAVQGLAHYERGMPRIVQKFGGTSVADLERIRNAALRVKREVGCRQRDRGRRLGDGRHDQPARRLDPPDEPAARRARIRCRRVVRRAGHGRADGDGACRISGLNARSWLGWQVPIRTDGVHGKARIEAIETSRARAALRRRPDPGRRRVPGDRPARAASRRWAAAARIPRRSRSPPRSRPIAAISSPMSTGFTRPIRASLPRRRS